MKPLTIFKKTIKIEVETIPVEITLEDIPDDYGGYTEEAKHMLLLGEAVKNKEEVASLVKEPETAVISAEIFGKKVYFLSTQDRDHVLGKLTL